MFSDQLNEEDSNDIFREVYKKNGHNYKYQLAKNNF